MPPKCYPRIELSYTNYIFHVQEAGLAEVLWANERKDDLRQFLAALILLGFNLVLTNYIGSSECDFELCKRILDENLDKYPNGVFFTFFKASGEIGVLLLLLCTHGWK